MIQPVLTKEDFHRLFEEYAACVDVSIEEELEAWGIEWEGLEDAVMWFSSKTAHSIHNQEVAPFEGLMTLAYVFFAMGVKCSMELELRRQAAQ